MAKRLRSPLQKTNDQENKWEIAFDQNPSPAIFKLHAIACYELFDYLELKDIHSMGQTCKRFNRIGGIYFQDNWISGYHIPYHRLNAFREYRQCLFVVYNNDVHHNRFEVLQANCKALKRIDFAIYRCSSIKPCNVQFDSMKETLAKIEYIQLSGLPSKNVHNMLKYCSNLKTLHIRFGFEAYTDKTWLHLKYPMLEDVRFGLMGHWRLEDCKILLEKNPNIRSFSCSEEFLVENEDWLLTTNVKLDYLGIRNLGTSQLHGRVCSLLKELHEREFYKKLRLTVCIIGQDVIDEIRKLPPVERLSLSQPIQRNIDFPVMVDVTEMMFNKYNHNNIEEFVTKFPNVERCIIVKLTFDRMLVVFKLLPRLKELLFCSSVWTPNLGQCRALNEERKKLPGANKITIYLYEEIYYKTKWACNKEDFEFIEIRRDVSWPHFSIPY